MMLMVAIVVTTFVALPAAAEVRPSTLFTRGMVLQREMPIPVWGQAAVGEKVVVKLADHSAEATAGESGTWSVKLPAMPAGGPHTLTIAGSNTIVIDDVLIGEVWLASGQSNMNMPIDWGIFGPAGSEELKQGLAEADFPAFRMFLVERAVAGQPAGDVRGSWMVCKGSNILKWSAAAYFFGRELHRELGVPVGIIKSALGGTPIESWMSRNSLIEAVPELAGNIEQWDKNVANFSEEDYQQELKAWQQTADKAAADGTPPPRKPVRATENPWRPNCLYNGMISPLAPYAIRGVIWYQGESNAHLAQRYRTTFRMMIKSWRAEWGQGDFPFIFVQLANFRELAAEPVESKWAELREAQTSTLSVPNTAMAVAIDIGEAGDIHPKNKRDVGLRLALAARKLAYGKDIVYSGPMLESSKVDGGKVRLTFSHIGGGLTAKGGPLKGFAMAGADGVFHWAEAKIDGAAVIVQSDKVAEPTALRYGWADNPECNLYNAEGLPASPFRIENLVPKPAAQ